MKATFAVALVALALVACGGDDPVPTLTPTATPYPDVIAWEQVADLLATGEVETVFQTHSLDVTFLMKDGSYIEAVEPGIDDIFRLVEECGSPCKDLALATE